MLERITITLPKSIEKIIERERKELGFNRSELFRRAIESFLGLKDKAEEEALQKYGPIYEALEEEDRRTSKEMMKLAKKTLPSD